MTTTEQIEEKPTRTKGEARIRARALYEAATAVMTAQPSWDDSERGTVINKIATRDAIIALIDPTEY